MLNQSFLANGSVFFFRPFLPFDNLLFFPTAMMAVVCRKGGRLVSLSASVVCAEIFHRSGCAKVLANFEKCTDPDLQN